MWTATLTEQSSDSIDERKEEGSDLEIKKEERVKKQRGLRVCSRQVLV